MKKWESIVASLEEGDYLTLVDLMEAYLHVLILEKHWKYLKFYNGNMHFQYRSMPFGLTAAHQVFIKLLVALVAQLRCQGVAFHPYQDDILTRLLFR